MDEAGKKRKRAKPNHKWTDQEVQRIVNYLVENRDFERPSVSLYYSNFLKQNKMDIDCELVKYKVKNLKIMYRKTKAWECSTGAGLFQEGGGNIKDELKRRCQYYEDLDDIFGCRKPLSDQSENIILDSLNDEFSLSAETVSNESNVVSPIAILTRPSNSSCCFANQVPCSTPTPTKSSQISDRMPKRTSRQKTSMDDLVETQKMRLEHQKLKLELEKDKLQFEKEKFYKTHELKKMEMEMNERIKMREMELKYDMREYADNELL